MLFELFILLHVPVFDPLCSDIVMTLRHLILGVIEYLDVFDNWTRTSIQHQYPSLSNIVELQDFDGVIFDLGK